MRPTSLPYVQNRHETPATSSPTKLFHQYRKCNAQPTREYCRFRQELAGRVRQFSLLGEFWFVKAIKTALYRGL